MQYDPEQAFASQSLVERINILRGLAIVGVVLIHTSAHFQYAEGLSPVVYANVVLDAFAHYAVPLFVLLSGLTLARRYGPARSEFGPAAFYRRRLIKVVPPYIVFSLLYLLLFALEYEPPTVSWVAFSLVTGNAYYHLWFVVLLVQLYLLFPLLRAAVLWADRRGRMPWLLLGALLLQLAWNLGAPLVASALPSRPLVTTLLSNRIFLSHIFYFVLGTVAGLRTASFEGRVLAIPGWTMASVVVVLTGLTSVIWTRALRGYGSLDAAPAALFIPSVAVEPALFLATIVLAWQIVARAQHKAGPMRDSLAQLGTVSFTIYLVHVFFQRVLAWALGVWGLTPAVWGFYLIVFFATVILSYAATWLLARIPFSEYLTGAPRLESGT